MNAKSLALKYLCSGTCWFLIIIALAPIIALFTANIDSSGFFELSSATAVSVLKTIVLAFTVAVFSAILGTLAAWLIEICVFPGRKLLGFLLFLPFAIPPYIEGYVWSDLIDDSGWLSAGYGVRNLFGACLVMSLVLYPYIYMFARAAFANRSHTLIAVARMLGCNTWQSFWKVAFPMARPAIAIGMLLVIMESVNDIAIAQDFGLQTLGYHIYDLWLNRDSKSSAIAVAALMMVFALCVAVFEMISRDKQRQYELAHKYYSNENSYHLKGWRALTATGFCISIVGLGFIVPIVYLLFKTLFSSSIDMQRLVASIFDTLWLVITVCVIGLLIGSVIGYLKRSLSWKPLQIASQMIFIGYALPGIVYGLGMITVATAVANLIYDVTEISIHWLWTTSTALLSIALVFRYIVIPTGAVESAISVIPPQIKAAGKSVGKSKIDMLIQIWLPLMRPSLIVGMMLLATDIIKELPLTLILRPFGSETLAVLVYQYASDEDITSAAPFALVMVIATSLMLAFSYKWIVPSWRKPKQN